MANTSQLISALQQIPALSSASTRQLNDVARSIENMGRSSQFSSKEIGGMFGTISNKINQLNTILRSSEQFFRAPIQSIKAFGKSFDDVIKTAGVYQQNLFLTSNSLAKVSGAFKTTGQAAMFYSKELQNITQSTKLGTLEAQRLYDSFTTAYKGIRDESALRSVRELIIAVGNLGLTAEETGKKLAVIEEIGNKYAEFRKGINETNIGLALLLRQQGKLSDIQIRAGIEIGGAVRTRETGAAGIVGSAFRPVAEFAQQRSQRQQELALNMAIIQSEREEFKKMVDMEMKMYDLADAMTGLIAKMENWAEITNTIADTLKELIDPLLVIFGGQGIRMLTNFLTKGAGSMVAGAAAGGAAGGAATGMGSALSLGRLIPGIGTLLTSGTLMYGGYKAYQAYRGYQAEKKIAGEADPGKMKEATMTIAALKSLAGEKGISEEKGKEILTLAEGYAKKINEAASANKWTEVAALTEAAAKQVDRYSAALDYAVSPLGKMQERIQQIENETSALVETSGQLAQEYGAHAQVMFETYGDAVSAANALNAQVEMLRKSAIGAERASEEYTKMYEELGPLFNAEYESKMKAAEAAKQAGEEDKARKLEQEAINALLSKQAIEQLAISNAMQAISKHAGVYKAELEATTKILDRQASLQQTDLETAERRLEYHTALKIGMGVQIQDILKAAKETMKLAQIEFSRADALDKLAQKMSREHASRESIINIEQQAQQARNAGLGKETAALEKMKSLREGYLSAFAASSFGVGGFAELMVSPEAGAQFLAPSPSLGRTFKTEAEATKAAMPGGLRRTLFGYEGDLGAYSEDKYMSMFGGGEYGKMVSTGNIAPTVQVGADIGQIASASQGQLAFLGQITKEAQEQTRLMKESRTTGGSNLEKRYTSTVRARGYAKGGVIGGSSNGDTVPAMLTPGEYVVPKKDAQFVKSLLEDGVRGYADGGEISDNNMEEIHNILKKRRTTSNPVLEIALARVRSKHGKERKAMEGLHEALTEMTPSMKTYTLEKYKNTPEIKKHQTEMGMAMMALSGMGTNKTGPALNLADLHKKARIRDLFSGKGAISRLAEARVSTSTYSSPIADYGLFNPEGFRADVSEDIWSGLKSAGSWLSSMKIFDPKLWMAAQTRGTSLETMWPSYSSYADVPGFPVFHNGGITQGGPINTIPGELVVPPPAAQNLIKSHESSGGKFNGSLEIILDTGRERIKKIVTINQLESGQARFNVGSNLL